MVTIEQVKAQRDAAEMMASQYRQDALKSAELQTEIEGLRELNDKLRRESDHALSRQRSWELRYLDASQRCEVLKQNLNSANMKLKSVQHTIKMLRSKDKGEKPEEEVVPISDPRAGKSFNPFDNYEYRRSIQSISPSARKRFWGA